MNEELHPEVDLLNAALAAPAGRRAALLAERCGGDPALRRRVEELLAAHAAAGDFLEAGLVGRPTGRGGLETARPGEQAGDRVGRYRLVAPMGEGGCGVVWRAEQEEPVRRSVALKVIKLGMDTRQVIARFEAERQVLALMDHPNIAKVYDAGSTAAGRPFFVMELVEGPRLTEFCDRNGLSTERRLQLFVAVCQAIQHAHQKGIIHRDIKPSNVLVTMNDGVPTPKVIDFGIAKATLGRLTDQTVFTAREQFVGTPAYVSPEQAAMAVGDIDTRSDIYSLGVLLYELLTGETPFEQRALVASGLDEMRRVIREVEPVKPSARRARAGAGSSATGALASDLDWIVMRCLEKDRARRYETAVELAADVRRFLGHEPVRARPPGSGYRLKKWIRRNRITFAALSVLGVALMIVAVGSAVAAWRVTGARRAEEVERRKAEAANVLLRNTVRLLELEGAEHQFREAAVGPGVAALASMLRRDPNHLLAANRLVSALIHRDWALPVTGVLRHEAPVASVRFSVDGRRVLTGSRDGRARLWDLATGEALVTVPHQARAFPAVFSPDGHRFLTASEEHVVQVLEASSGAAVGAPLRHEGRVHWAEFGADGRQVLTASADRRARIWEAATGRLWRELRGHSTPVVLARFHPRDPQRVVTAGAGGAVRLWDGGTGETQRRLEDRGTNVTALVFSPDGEQLLVAGADGLARRWLVASGVALEPPLRHRDAITSAAYSPDGRLLLTTSHDGTARLWEAASGLPAGPSLSHQGGVVLGAFSPDGRWVATSSMDNTVRIWDVATGAPWAQPVREEERTLSVDFSPDSRRLAMGSFNRQARVWDLRARRAQPLEVHAGRKISTVSFRPDGRTILTGGDDGTARQWDAGTGRPMGAVIQQTGWVHSAQYDGVGRRIVTASFLPTTHVWDAESGAAVAGPFAHGYGLWSAGFSPDGGRVVTTAGDGTVRLWSVATSQPISPELRHASEVRMARFSRDGRRLLTVSKEAARVWDARTGEAVGGPLVHLDHVRWAEFSPDGERVVTASTDNSACVWEVRSARAVAPLLRHARIVELAVFSRDGRRIATGSLDRTARVWDALTGEPLTPALVHPGTVSMVEFSPDGARLLTVVQGGPARLWDVATGRPLTEWFDERRDYGAAFDAGGQRLVMGGAGARVWAVPPAPVPVPGWFAEFAEAVAGMRIDPRGNVELTTGFALADVARQRAADGSDRFYSRLVDWFLADPDGRSGEPFGPEPEPTSAGSL